MKKLRGFTLIEASLFLAITGLLVVGVIVATNRSLANQHYNYAVQDVSSFLSQVYSSVIYTENTSKIDDSGNPNGGRTPKLIYGKLVTFGENANSADGDASKVYVYSVIGDILSADEITNFTDLNALELFYYLNINVVYSDESLRYAVFNQESFSPSWNAILETSEKDELLHGSILILRSPISGVVYTYVYDGTIPVQSDAVGVTYPSSVANNLLKDHLPVYTGNTANDKAANEARQSETLFKAQDFDICVYSEDVWAAGNIRQDIRVVKSGRNSTAVQIIGEDQGSVCEV